MANAQVLVKYLKYSLAACVCVVCVCVLLTRRDTVNAAQIEVVEACTLRNICTDAVVQYVYRCCYIK